MAVGVAVGVASPWPRTPRSGCEDGGSRDSGGCCAGCTGRCLRRRRRGLSPPLFPPPLAFARCGFVMATTQRPYHLVVFGASGFTGQFVTEEVAREQVDLEGNSRLPWAVAGRSAEKLQRALERAALKLGKGGGVGRGSGPPLLSPPQLSSPGRGDRATRDERFSFLAARLELHKPCWRTGKQSDASNSVLALFSVMLKIVVISFPSFDFLLYFG